jgi:thiamine biosynthesis lipoprotein
VPQHHIIDPRSGQPATTDVLTATVLAGHAQQAEAAAKMVVILGSQAGLAWLDAQPTLAGLVVREDGQLLRSMRMPPLQN